jgi:uncharacterized protein DUF4235
MTKMLFIPFSVAGGFLAGMVGKKAFERVWRLIDEENPPEPDQREVTWPKLALALVLQGAIFRAVRGLFDHGSRELFRRTTGRWPGEQAPERARP